MSDDSTIKDLKEEIRSEFSKVNERLNSIDKTLVKQEANWEHHVYRTDLAEDNIKILRENTENAIGILQKEIEPLKTKKAMIDGALKFIGLIAAIVGIVAGIVKIITSI